MFSASPRIVRGAPGRASWDENIFHVSGIDVIQQPGQASYDAISVSFET